MCESGKVVGSNLGNCLFSTESQGCWGFVAGIVGCRGEYVGSVKVAGRKFTGLAGNTVLCTVFQNVIGDRGGTIFEFTLLVPVMLPRRANCRNETPLVDHALAAAVQQAIRTLLHELTTEIAASMNNANNPNNVNRRNERSGGNGNGGNGGDVPATIHYLLRSEQEKYEREYKSICQLDGETTIEFMTRFIRLAGFMGAEAGTLEEQAKNFKWALNDIPRDKLVNMKFTNVAKVANAARNIKILQKEMLASTQNDNKKRTREDEQDENEARLGKQRDNHRISGTKIHNKATSETKIVTQDVPMLHILIPL
uniref:Zinc finger, CCHC-type, retrotransposon Gag domain protein n=1 Tax=Tanacetum cinerariifolium TaxID=118510 RepID=A0A6L2KFY7_TANCI|nr:zinc finger, CCHC-type, retrotransposon Gag domain protein [Tanacetum cinerariifolium]